MSEKDEKLNKGSFLYIGDQDKAEWGYPEGYPKKSVGTTTPMASAFLPQATQTTYGAIKKAAHVPHVTEAPTSNDFNKLLSALKEAGIMSQAQ